VGEGENGLDDDVPVGTVGGAVELDVQDHIIPPGCCVSKRQDKVQ
jgi:hypothetical protein